MTKAQRLDIAVEPVNICGAELLPLMAAFARENSKTVAWAPPTLEQLQRREAAGMQVFALRYEGRMVGFCLASRVFDGATDGGMFIDPDYRGGIDVLRLVAYVEAAMRLVGAKWMTWECDEHSGSHVLAERLKYRLQSRRYINVFNEGEAL